MVRWPLEGFPWAEAPGHRPQGMSYMLQFFSLNGISIPFQSRPKACKPFLYANPGCVGSPGVFITPGTYFIRVRWPRGSISAKICSYGFSLKKCQFHTEGTIILHIHTPYDEIFMRPRAEGEQFGENMCVWPLLRKVSISY